MNRYVVIFEVQVGLVKAYLETYFIHSNRIKWKKEMVPVYKKEDGIMLWYHEWIHRNLILSKKLGKRAT